MHEISYEKWSEIWPFYDRIFFALNEFDINKAQFKKFKYLENYTLEGVNEILYNCWETETNIKTGKIGMESGVERLITFISSKNNKK